MSDTTKHTAGPWQVVGDCVYTVKKWRNGVHQHIATVSKVGASINDYEANAALIASAPALAARVETLEAANEALLGGLTRMYAYLSDVKTVDYAIAREELLIIADATLCGMPATNGGEK